MESIFENLLKESELKLQMCMREIENFVETSREINDRAAERLAHIEKSKQECKSKITTRLERDEIKIQKLESDLQLGELALMKEQQKYEEMKGPYLRKMEQMENIKVPDMNEILDKKHQISSVVKNLRIIISLYISISKIRWDILNPETCSGKVLKDNISIPFDFSNESNSYKSVHELWEIM